MRESSDTVLGRARVREVTGVFHSPSGLEAAANALLLAGFDRADIDRIGSLDELHERLGPIYVAAEELADVRHVPRRPLIAREDITTTVWVVGSTVGSICALATAYAVLVSGGEGVWAGLAAVIIGVIAGGLATLATARLLRPERAKGLESLMAARGLILWVRVRSAEAEAKAQEILLAHGAEAVRVHEIEIEKRPDEIPLSSLRPDPWLGEERLGHP